jgi:hypothetical protein
MAAQSSQKSESALGEFYRRMRAKLGAPEAITAAAQKLARVVFHLLKTREAYDDTVFAKSEQKCRQRTEARLRVQAHAFGYLLTPVTGAAMSVPWEALRNWRPPTDRRKLPTRAEGFQDEAAAPQLIHLYKKQQEAHRKTRRNAYRRRSLSWAWF